MKSLVFDTGPIISLVTDNLLWILKPLKEKFGGEFYITPKVKNELIDKPLQSKRFKFEAITILEYIKDGTLKIQHTNAEYLEKLANSIFKIKDRYLTIVSKGEVEALLLTSTLKADALVVDERTTRMLVESPMSLTKILTKKLHADVTMDKNNLNKFQTEISKVNVIRSSELLTIAYELGLLSKYLTNGVDKRTLLDGLLWGTKLRGCAISDQEINDIIRLEKV